MICPQCGEPTLEGAAICPACGSELPAVAERPDHDPETAAAIAAPEHAPAGVAGYAGFWRRTVAIFIDSIVLVILALSLGFIPALAILTGRDPTGAIGNLAGAIAARGALGWLYFAGLECSDWQATLGKRLIGLRVTDSSGARIRFGRASGRFFGKLLSCAPCGLGFVMAAFTARRQSLHDLLAGTLVVR